MHQPFIRSGLDGKGCQHQRRKNVGLDREIGEEADNALGLRESHHAAGHHRDIELTHKRRPAQQRKKRRGGSLEFRRSCQSHAGIRKS